MKRRQLLLVLIGGIFFAAVMSLYHMLEVMQRTDLKTNKGLPGAQMDEVSHEKMDSSDEKQTKKC